MGGVTDEAETVAPEPIQDLHDRERKVETKELEDATRVTNTQDLLQTQLALTQTLGVTKKTIMESN